jgi:hypothetical protein
MYRIFLFLLFTSLSLSSCQRCKKEKKMVTYTGTIYKDCDSLSRNMVYTTKYYKNTKGDIHELRTDQNGRFTYQLEKYANDDFSVYAPNSIVEFTQLGGGFDSDHDWGIIREVYNGYAVIKIKTQQGLAAGNTLNYLLEYSYTTNTIHGPITKDTIITTLVFGMNNSWDNADNSDNKTLWWALNKQPVDAQDTRLDYRVHSCNINSKDTAYIVIP